MAQALTQYKSSGATGEKWHPAKYQQAMVRWLVTHPAAALFADPGLRKTSCVLAAYLALRKAHGTDKMLVIAPKRVCELVWSHDGEVGKWLDFQGLTVSLLHGDHKEQALAKDADLHVINPEGLAWLCNCTGCRHKPHARLKCREQISVVGKDGRAMMVPCPCEERHSTHMATLVKKVHHLTIDELSAFKHPDVLRFQLIRPWLGHFRRRWGLTGSPAPNGLIDLFGQVFVLDLGRTFGPYITHYRHKYFLPTGFGGYDWKLQDGAEKKIYKKLKPLALSLRAEDHLDLPPLLEQELYITLPTKAQRHYNELEAQLCVLFDSGQVTAANAAVASGKLRQLTGGSVYADNDERTAGGSKRAVHKVHDAKVEGLAELISELQGTPLLVAYEFEHELDRIRTHVDQEIPALNGRTTAKAALDMMKKWNAGKLPVLCGQPQAMAHGLNMQGCGHHVAWYTLPWNQETYDQTNRRLHRSGQKNRVIVHRLLTRGTIDEIVARALTMKKRVQDELLEALKRRSRTVDSALTHRTRPRQTSTRTRR